MGLKGASERLAKTIEIDDEEIKVKVDNLGLAKILTAAEQQGENKILQIMEGMFLLIKKANPDVSDEDVRAFVSSHYGTLLPKLLGIFGFQLQKSEKVGVRATADYVLKDVNGNIKEVRRDVPVDIFNGKKIKR